MTPERYQHLTTCAGDGLTKEEREAGYHFCPDWDFLLIGPGFVELEGCACKIKYFHNYYCSAHDDFNCVRCETQCTACATAHGRRDETTNA